MSNAIFPTFPGLTWNIIKTPQWSTRIQRSVSGKETRMPNQSRTIWKFSMSYEVLRGGSAYTELQQLMAFFNQRQGSFDSFLLTDSSDSTATNQNFGTGDGTTKTFALLHSIQGWLEPIGGTNGTPTVYVNFNDWRGNALQYSTARTNLLTYSEHFDNAAWSKGAASVMQNAMTSPDGSVTAGLLIEDTTNAQHNINRTAPTTSGASYVLSWYLKAGTRNRVQLAAFGTVTALATFDLASGIVVGSSNTSATITSAPNGFWRCTITFTAASSGTTIVAYLVNTATNNSYVGDGASGLYLFGAQLETGNTATSYVPSADTFTSRASTATYIGSNGLIQTAAVNVARMQYNPSNLAAPAKLLLEGVATNLLTYSEQFDNAAWGTRWGGGATITANDATYLAPDGNQTVDKVVATSGGSGVGAAVSLTAGQAYTFSCWVASPSNACTIGFGASSTASPSLSTVGVPAGASLQRYSVTFTPSSSGTYYVGASDTVALQTFYIWGAQLEAGSYATSYIPTTAAAVTRSSDVSSSTAGTVTDYTTDGANVTFGTAPPSNAALTWTGSFYYRVRFMQDMLDFDQFMKDLWQLKKCELVGVI